MRLIGACLLVYLLAAAFVLNVAAADDDGSGRPLDGQTIFRYDTFGDEQLWTGVLRMHEAVQQVDPATALAVGLKVDVDALPESIRTALRAGAVDLKDPAVTAALLRLNAVVGVQGSVDASGRITQLGVTCALCHSSVDNSFAPAESHREHVLAPP